MKKLILAVALVSMTLVGCAQAPQRGYYDEDGNYHPSQSAQNADNASTAATVGLGILAAGALAVGIAAKHKANKADSHHDNPVWDRDEHRNREWNQNRNHRHDHRHGW